MHERTRTLDGEVQIDDGKVQDRQNLLQKGVICRAGNVVLPAGSLLNPPALGLVASVGRTEVRVVPRPRLTIVPTGDELVEPDQTPGPGQIRNSNAIILEALAMDHGALPRVLPIAPDDPVGLRESLEQGSEADVLVVTGGVSAGQRDLVPAVLDQLGVTRIFHKVQLKPGKPLWFGYRPRRDGKAATLVFGLPGNPVSSLVGFLLFIRPALRALAGRLDPMPEPETMRLRSEFVQRGTIPWYYPARLVERSGALEVGTIETLKWAGSADLVGIARADGLAIFPAGERVFQPGEIVRFLPLG
jgi:molybdopterin molybdotransferase